MKRGSRARHELEMEAIVLVLAKPCNKAILGVTMLEETHLAVYSGELDIHRNRRVAEAEIIERCPRRN